MDSYILTASLDYGFVGLFVLGGAMLYGAAACILLYMRQDKAVPEALPVGCMLAVFAVTKIVLSQEDNHTLIFALLGCACAVFYRSQQAKGDNPSA